MASEGNALPQPSLSKSIRCHTVPLPSCQTWRLPEEPAQVAAPEDIDVAAEAFAQAAAAEGGFATGIQGQVVGDDVAEGPVLDDAGDGAAGDIGTKEPAQRDLGLAAATAVADECLRIMAHSSTARRVANAQEAKVTEGH
ncbi:hypothetical protein GGI18_003791 [Coemansia linderi]|uniref:Uncharacterized protein n=1 Tax=Coemansia linderi TaxID=2663919 RepID=A0ACC1KBS3_9FUNG|nr:hypothetical protein GGI18_003791 [Coemansia linderi]